MRYISFKQGGVFFLIYRGSQTWPKYLNLDRFYKIKEQLLYTKHLNSQAIVRSEDLEKMEKHILVIDDDITSLDIVSYFFEDRGYRVDRCADGASAIEYVKTHKPDLLIVDLMMPEINGKETVEQIRALGLTTVPIIAFTAVDEPELHLQALEAGCNEVLTKPCRPEKLLKHIETYLSK